MSSRRRRWLMALVVAVMVADLALVYRNLTKAMGG